MPDFAPVGMSYPSYPVNAGMAQLAPLPPTSFAPPLNRPAVSPLITPDGRIMVPQPEPRGEKGVLDFVKNVGVGAIEGVTDMAKGVVFLAKGAVHIATHPIQTVKKVGHGIGFAIKNPAAAGQTLARIPGAIVTGIVKPYREAWQNGEYGKVVGRLGVDIAMIYLTSQIGKAPAAGEGMMPMTVAGDLTPGLGGGAGTAQQIVTQSGNTVKNTLAKGAIDLKGATIHGDVIINNGVMGGVKSTVSSAGAAGATGLGAAGLDGMGVMGNLAAGAAGGLTPELAVQALNQAKTLGVLGHTAEVSQAARTISTLGLAANAKEVAAAARVLRNAGHMVDYMSVAQALHIAKVGTMGMMPGMNVMGTMGRMGTMGVNQFGVPVMNTMGQMGTMIRPMGIMPTMGVMTEGAGLGAGLATGGYVVGGATPTMVMGADGVLRTVGGFERMMSGLGRAADLTGSVIGKTGQVAGKVITGTFEVTGKVLQGVVHPFQTLRNGVNFITNPATWTSLQQSAIVGANQAAVGLGRAADWTGRALVFAAHHPAHAAAVTGLVGKGGMAAHDGLQHMDLIR